MNRKYCRLYVNSEQYLHSSITDAKEAAIQYISQKAELRIEYLFETDEPDFWDYEYNNEKWVPS
ncbi:hypothetical protein ACXJY6_02020 [Vibrio sp. RC27]